MAKEAVPDTSTALLAIIEAILTALLGLEGRSSYPPAAITALQQLDAMRHQLHKAAGSEPTPIKDKNSRLKLPPGKKETA